MPWMFKNLVGNSAGYSHLHRPVARIHHGRRSGVDSNLNGDSAPDRSIINPLGIPNTSTNVTPLKNSMGATVAYLANDPTAQYIQAGPGAFASAARNTLAAPHINNWDFSLLKR